MPTQFPGRKALVSTFASSVGIQVLTILAGVVVARVLGPDGRGLLAGSQVWAGILGMVVLLGINNVLSIRAADRDSNHAELETLGLLISMLPIGLCMVIGWPLMSWLVPEDQPELLFLSRFSLLSIPIFAWTSILMAIDQGRGDFRRFNLTRNILTPTYLVLIFVLSLSGTREVFWFLLALIASNFVALTYRLMYFRPVRPEKPIGQEAADLLRDGFRFWITGVVHVLRDNAEKIVIMLVLPVSSMGFYTVAFTASGVHLTVGRSFNLVIFSRSARLDERSALLDVAKLFRTMAVINFGLGIALASGLPILIPLVYGEDFVPAIWPAILLIASQFFLSQGMLINEGLRARRRPYAGMNGMLLGTCMFVLLVALSGQGVELIHIALASIVGQAMYCFYMVHQLRKECNYARLMPGLDDVRGILTGARNHLRPSVAKA